MNRHPLDVFSLLSGLVLCCIALAALFGVGTEVAPWVWPATLVGSGVVVLAIVAGAAGRGEDPVAVAPADPLHAAARAEVEAVDVTSSAASAPLTSPTSSGPAGGDGDAARAD